MTYKPAKLTPRQKVLQVYPDAFTARGYGIWSGETVQVVADRGRLTLSEAKTTGAAWRLAAQHLPAAGKGEQR
jgi:hypothetical protein